MKHFPSTLMPAAAAVALLAFPVWAADDAKSTEAVKRIRESTSVLSEIMQGGDGGIPHDLLHKAHCAVIVPGLKKGAFIVGAKYGKGVILCRKASGGWLGPGTVKIEGGSFGLQLGAGETDMVLLVMNERGARSLLNSEFKIGGEAGAMAGPVGRTVQAETDAAMRAEMLGYSRSHGVFAGVSLQGSTLREDLDDNALIYGKRVSNEDIMEGRVAASNRPEAVALRSLLSSYSVWEKK